MWERVARRAQQAWTDLADGDVGDRLPEDPFAYVAAEQQVAFKRAAHFRDTFTEAQAEGKTLEHR